MGANKKPNLIAAYASVLLVIAGTGAVRGASSRKTPAHVRTPAGASGKQRAHPAAPKMRRPAVRIVRLTISGMG